MVVKGNISLHSRKFLRIEVKKIEFGKWIK